MADAEHRIMLDFLLSKGWFPSYKDMEEAMESYELKEDFKLYKQMNK